MAMHTRRDLLRTSLLFGGALHTPRIWAACVPSYTAGHTAILVGGSAAFVDSFNMLVSPAPPATLGAAPAPKPAPVAMSAPVVASARTGALTAINPAVVGPTTFRPAYVFSFSLAWPGAGQPIANWVAGAANHAPTLQDGSFRSYNFTYNEVTRQDWTGGAISQVTWPGCDVASTAMAIPVITVGAATMHWQRGDGSSFPGPINIKRKYWRACDFLVTSNVNISASQIASVSALTLAPAAYGGTVAFGFNVGFNAAEAAILLAPFQAAVGAGGVLVPGQSTDIAIQFLATDARTILATVTLRNCRVGSVSTGLPGPVVTMNYADASLSILVV